MKDFIRVELISGGRESTAMSLELAKRFGPNFSDVKIFSDTGDDPEGRKTVDRLIKDFGWNITIVQSKHGPIDEYYANKKVVDKETGLDGHAMPSQTRKDCSMKFKIAPIRGYLRWKYGKSAKFILYYGFTMSKKDIGRKIRMLKPEYRIGYCSYKFPLIDIFKYDRLHCTQICESRLGFVPERSACTMCFQKTLKDWKGLFSKDKRRAIELMEFEESSLLFKQYGYGLNGVPLRTIFKLNHEKPNQLRLFSDEEIKKIEGEQEMVKEISIGCDCMNDAGLACVSEIEDENFVILHEPKEIIAQ